MLTFLAVLTGPSSWKEPHQRTGQGKGQGQGQGQETRQASQVSALYELLVTSMVCQRLIYRFLKCIRIALVLKEESGVS